MVRFIYFLFIVLLAAGCTQGPVEKPLTAEEKAAIKKADHRLFHNTLRKHLKATADKDIETLKTLMAPDGFMHLMRPATPVVYTTDLYIIYHESWFQDPDWSIETTITDSDVGTDMGMALVALKYMEPENDGKPYWNEMLVSYTLKKYDDGAWYVILDHSSSVKKSTDKK